MRCAGKMDWPKEAYQIAVSTRTDLNSTDDQYGIIRALGIGLVATSLTKGWCSIFWFLIGGCRAAQAYIYCGIAACLEFIQPDGLQSWIERWQFKTETAFCGCSANLSSVLIAGGIGDLLLVWRAQSEDCWAVKVMLLCRRWIGVTAIAYALGVSLGGPVEDISGSVLKRSWVGSSKSTARSSAVICGKPISIWALWGLSGSLFIVLGLLAWVFLPSRQSDIFIHAFDLFYNFICECDIKSINVDWVVPLGPAPMMVDVRNFASTNFRAI